MTQTDEPLTGLCLLCACRDTSIDWDAVVNTFAAENPRKMSLINVMDESKYV